MHYFPSRRITVCCQLQLSSAVSVFTCSQILMLFTSTLNLKFWLYFQNINLKDFIIVIILFYFCGPNPLSWKPESLTFSLQLFFMTTMMTRFAGKCLNSIGYQDVCVGLL